MSVDKDVTVKSVNGYSNTIISGSPGYGGAGGSTSGCVSVRATNAIVDGFTCTNGRDYGGNGGPNRVWKGTLQNCLIVNCIAGGAGGGLIIWDNVAPLGPATVKKCIIKRNYAGSGGGGGIYIANNNVIIENCLITENLSGGGSASRGGGVQVVASSDSTPTNGSGYMANCTIAANTSLYAGGIAFVGTNILISVVNCVIYSNKTTTAAGSVVSNDLHDFSYPTNIGKVSYSCASRTNVFNGVGLMTNHPLFLDSSAGNWRLSLISPCINRGTNQSWMTNAVDLDGRMRIRYGTVDMGAYERIHEATFYRFH